MYKIGRDLLPAVHTHSLCCISSKYMAMNRVWNFQFSCKALILERTFDHSLTVQNGYRTHQTSLINNNNLLFVCLFVSIYHTDISPAL